MPPSLLPFFHRPSLFALEPYVARRAVTDIYLACLWPQRKAERLERLREDPYYLMDDRPPPTQSAPSADDVDSIPVVRLDDMPPLPTECTFLHALTCPR